MLSRAEGTSVRSGLHAFGAGCQGQATGQSYYRNFTAVPRVLIVTCEFPPLGGVGVQRCLKFAKYLPTCGWDVSVLTVADPPGRLRDESLLQEVAEGVRVHRVWSPEPMRLVQLAGRVPGVLSRNSAEAGELPQSGGAPPGFPGWLVRLVQAFFVPDEKVLWRRGAIRRGLQVIAEDRCQALISSGPPNTAHLIAFRLKKQTGLPWIADFRDPWVGNYFFHPPTPAHMLLHKKLESEVVRNADIVVTVGELMRHSLRRRYPDLVDHHFATVFNGFDPEDLLPAHDPEHAGDTGGNVLTICYSGVFQGTISPDVFLRGLRLALDKGLLPEKRVRVWFIGPRVCSVENAVREARLNDVVEITGYLAHKEAVSRSSKGDLMLLVLGPEAASAQVLTGKLFEYLGMRKTILALAPEGEASHLIKRLRAGIVVDPSDAGAVAPAVGRLYGLWEEGRLPVPSPGEVSAFERERESSQLAGILDDLLPSSTAVSPQGDELERVAGLYRKRDSDPSWSAMWSDTNAVARWIGLRRDDRLRGLVSSLRGQLGEPHNWRVLEVGVGSGGLLPWLHQHVGVPERALAGIDLVRERAELAQARLPEADIRVGSASDLPWTSEYFSLVVASTLFSSIRDVATRAAAAAECGRVLGPHGAVLWYDMRDDFWLASLWRRLAGPEEEWLGAADVRSLFPGWRLELLPATLFVPFARPLIRLGSFLPSALEGVAPGLRGHYLGLLWKP